MDPTASFPRADIVEEWRHGVRRASTSAANAGAEVEVFSRRFGTPGAPALVCVHGFPIFGIATASATTPQMPAIGPKARCWWIGQTAMTNEGATP